MVAENAAAGMDIEAGVMTPSEKQIHAFPGDDPPPPA